jgi:predicted dithiol-disulfide oxidoreductase (DUF899 family)
MGRSFKWVSAGENGFNYDYYVSFKQEEIARGEIYHNYQSVKQGLTEHASIGAFCKNPRGELFHTYSCYARGLDTLNAANHGLDLMPKRRDEDGSPSSNPGCAITTATTVITEGRASAPDVRAAGLANA